MRKIWTRLVTLALVLVVTISFSACSLFTTNLDQKYSTSVMVVKSAHDDITISRRELYYGYLEWGYQYADYFSSTNDLLEYIATSLLNNKILEKQSIERFGELRPVEEALALKQAYQSLDNTLRTYIYESLNLEEPKEETASDDEENEVDKPYNPSVLVDYENGERVYTMNLSEYKDEDGVGALSLSTYEYYAPTIPGGTAPKNVKQGLSKIVRNLQSVESGFTKLKAPDRDYLMPENEYFQYFTQAERDVLNREIDRMVKSNRTSILIDRINVAYNLGFFSLQYNDAVIAWNDYLQRGENFTAWCNLINGYNLENRQDLPAYFGCGRAMATSRANEAIDLYISRTALAINNHKNFSKSELESTLVSSGLADVYYIPPAIADNLYTVSHILIQYSDEQKTELKNIETKASKDETFNKQNAINTLHANTKSNDVSAYDILNEVDAALRKVDQEDALSENEKLQKKCAIFHDYINKYNSDPGMQNLEQLDDNSKPQYEYLMSGNADNSKMVKEFTDASVELFEAGKKGAISGLVWTEYGAHIIMYTRDVSDFIFTGVPGQNKEEESINLLQQYYEQKLFAPLTSYGKRTLFDTLVDTCCTRNVSTKRANMLKDYKHEHEITMIKSEFKNFI